MWPEINFFGLSFPTYFLVLSLVFSFIIYALILRAKCVKVNVNKALDLYLYILVGSFLGARAFYVIYQAPSFFLENPLQIFYVWNGGFVFYGGFIGGVLSILLFTKLRKESLSMWFNFSAPLLAFGYGLGRFACLLNGCCYGDITDHWWSINLHSAFRHPTQIYASFWELILFVALLNFERIKGFNKGIPVFSIWLIGHGIGRLMMEYFRVDDRGSLILGFSVSSVISFVLIFFGFFFVFRRTKILN